MDDEIGLEGPAAWLRQALRVDRQKALKDTDDSDYWIRQAAEEIAALDEVLIGIVEDLACYGGQPYVRDRIYDRIGAMYSCDWTKPHTHADGLPGGGPYREQCAAR